MFSVIIKPRALEMIQQGFDWYEEQKPGLGDEFLQELESFFSRIKSNPQYFGKIRKNFRQAALKRFPYVIVFETFKTEIVVFAVFHTSRNPKFKFKD
ncbi:MAG TPA: type II toxin-antitoxin system RelE/ParE family toxin [Chitinophagaceae bacterium]|jgi:plasmid stabilization system protein ParE|nr:type II toxin-antitoxin system RelE/ParE family toxin [Chitinophagaceae bacterium]HMU57481.1 type II toxin-antitoxin system RelE/ParE family toxin [Chitinophagaceae bacterium]